MSAFVHQVLRFARDEDGVTAVEYGLLAVLIAVALMAGASLVGSNLDTLFSSLGSMM
ncbi:Flp family type IVb pilin [Burkholderia sp. Ac-20353]|uniref:Flp family type IVb pilin n=1 Tax=Burkholderia sp. Ac-20353 TaxID=2703894 RepID=UPI00197B675E|nr:Flp family type IVb pilin [Burkholderia sp. Ac-20353]MBN3791650.1 Flp family type IVb pilin [Burkholderia sp. Ac-20353]